MLNFSCSFNCLHIPYVIFKEEKLRFISKSTDFGGHLADQAATPPGLCNEFQNNNLYCFVNRNHNLISLQDPRKLDKSINHIVLY